MKETKIMVNDNNNKKQKRKKKHNRTSPLNTSLCTDVPPPSEKIGRRDFFLREGGRLYTG